MEEVNYRLRSAIVSLLTIVGFCTCFAVVVMALAEPEQEPAPIMQVIDTVYTEHQLTEWQLFQLALIEVESEYQSEAISSENARGIFQETPIYVADVNRIIGTEWTHTDAHNDTVALSCFTVIQDEYNPRKDIQTAIRLHNPNAGLWYERRIMGKMAEIRRREQVRTLIINY